MSPEWTLRSLKQILTEPNRIDAAIKNYKRGQSKESPRLNQEIKLVTNEVKAIQLKVKNLVDRIAELPSDVSAAPMYERIKELQKQIEDKEKGILRLEKDRGRFEAGIVTDDGLRNVITKTIERLEEAPKEKQREIFENVIQFAEFYPNNRIRLGVYSESDPKKRSRLLC